MTSEIESLSPKEKANRKLIYLGADTLSLMADRMGLDCSSDEEGGYEYDSE